MQRQRVSQGNAEALNSLKINMSLEMGLINRTEITRKRQLSIFSSDKFRSIFKLHTTHNINMLYSIACSSNKIQIDIKICVLTSNLPNNFRGDPKSI